MNSRSTLGEELFGLGHVEGGKGEFNRQFPGFWLAKAH